jgi:hypothetical protein
MAPDRRAWVLRWLAAVAAAAAVAAILLPHAGAQESTDVPTQLKKVKATLADAKADAKKLATALDRANAALDQAENELAQADQQRRNAHARGVQATAALQDATRRVDQLRRIMGDRARGVYIAGDPTGLNALVQSGKADQLLGQVAGRGVGLVRLQPCEQVVAPLYDRPGPVLGGDRERLGAELAGAVDLPALQVPGGKVEADQRWVHVVR